MVAAVDALDECILSVYSEKEHEEPFGCSPVLYCDYKAFEKRMTIQENISHLQDTYWGTHACHPDNTPEDWVMPGGLPQMSYHSKLDVRVKYDPNKYDSDKFEVLVDNDGK
eukprot:3273246-Ditylum_brightwellii.AAC.1